MIIMKKFLFTMAFALVGLATQAQTWSIGPQVGVGYNWMSKMDNDKGKIGFNAGFIVNYSNEENFGLGLGAKYSREGVITTVAGRDMETTIDYVRLPLTFTAYFNDLSNNFRPKIYLGPQVGFIVGGETEMFSENGLATISSKDAFNDFDYGLVGGVGFNYRIAPATWLNFDVTHYHGLKNVSDALDSNNRNVSVNFGVAFGF